MQRDYGLAAFRSRQQVQYFQTVLRREGVPSEIVNTPHQIAIGCGVSVQFALRDYDRVREIYEAHAKGKSTSFVGFYAVTHPAGRLQVNSLYRQFLQ